MADTTKREANRAQIQGSWSDASDLEQLYVDELLICGVKEHLYLLFGQIQMPPLGATRDSAPATVEIRPVVKVALTRDALQRMVAVVNRVLLLSNEEEA